MPSVLREFILALSLLALVPFAAAAQTAAPLAGAVFGTGKSALVVVLHGDLSDGSAADYHRRFAESLARSNPGITAVALIRPGYSDSEGRTSPGSHNGRRDHYTARNNDLVAQTITGLKRQVRPQRTITIGHSGGAAQLGAVIGRNPGLIDSAILVSCPCNVTEWRSMNRRPLWTDSESPHSYIPRVAKKTRIIAITGRNDRNTHMSLAETYVASARARGIDAHFVPVGGGHNFRDLQRAVAQVAQAEIPR